MPTPVALTIAGFDPSGGAGVIADVRTFAAFGCFPTAVITSLTFQNTVGVYGANNQTPEVVSAQFAPIVADFRVAAVKTGMLPSRLVIEEVARLIQESDLEPLVIDPVVRSTSGYDLIDDSALNALIDHLFPLARVVTPNLPEVERITGIAVRDLGDMQRAAQAIRERGARAVLVKGGHSLEQEAIDLLDDDGTVNIFREQRIETSSTHGTGCTLSAGIAACLGLGLDLNASVSAAKRYVTDAIREAPGLGQGHGPINHNVKARPDSRGAKAEK